MDIMHMSLKCQRAEICISPLLVRHILYVITAMDLAIEVMNARRRTHSFVATNGTIMLNMEAIMELMNME